MREPAPRDSNTESGELRAERDRFAAFALAAAAARRDAESGLLDGAAFQAAATAALNDGAHGDLTLTLLDVAGIDELRSTAGEGAVSRLLGEIGDFLSAHAIDGASAGRI